MIQDFSEGYYYLSMDLTRYADGPAIGEPLHSFIQNELFTKESPVIMRLGLDSGPTFDVRSEASVPRGVLALPQEFLTSDPDGDIFVLKPEYVDTVGEYNG